LEVDDCLVGRGCGGFGVGGDVVVDGGDDFVYGFFFDGGILLRSLRLVCRCFG